ncbi:Type 2A phosphatase-associated protein 42 [Metarhizium acridum]|uniref:TOR signaling pathway regulator (TapA), putative n=1 Tax=Metarhizium acridum (strain CQMa 102) TaxID=655827 RepID=E9E978_METAQ|nr:TOR signaling pathway regulator (TapA), putative [Metarhizium acridum CQMa 102]EFY87582.1 TOR signaling pathway regulator (TapA), putative [Metarhizium acridum CQMa 102]KAG8425409.1 Type 2A phosphatase-associated protein 42 [Metarhizium acridum]
MPSKDEPQSLRTALEEAESKRRLLESSPDATSPTYLSDLNSVLALYARVLDQISSVSLFSPNEGLEDIATSSLPYILVNFTIAELVQRTPFTVPARRKLVLRAARDAYERFLSLVDGYGLVSGPYAKLLERYRDDEEQFAVVSKTGDMASKRDAKIASFKAEKGLREKLDLLKSDRRYVDKDEEATREVYLADVACKIHQTFQGLEGLNREAEMLAMAPEPEPETSARHPREEADDASVRLDQPLGRSGRAGGPLLSREGRPLQPFTLVGSRADLARGVFRPGHNLPTMSIDEYLAEEKRRGNILEGGTDPPRVEVDEDDMDAVDRETYKAREWDDFKDDNRRGAGNTLNMG